MRAYSITQIQFECLRYIKEFGATPAAWQAMTCQDPQASLCAISGAPDRCLWLTKPALTPRAARAVVERLHGHYGVVPVASPQDADGRHVLLIRDLTDAVPGVMPTGSSD